MDRQMKPSIQNSETAILMIPHTTDARHNTTVHYQNRHLEIRLWSSTPPAGYKWRYSSVWISLEVIQRNRAKLWNIRPRTPSDNPCTHRMATLPHGIFIPSHCQVRSQKPDILLYCSETQPTTSTLESLSIWIWPESHPHPRHTDGAICHGPCSVTFFLKNNQRMAPTESPMMAASPLFSATITTGHLHRTYIGAPSEYFLHSATTKTTWILIIVITNQHHVLSTTAQPQPHHAPHMFHVPGQSGIRVSLLYVHSTTICSSQ